MFWFGLGLVFLLSFCVFVRVYVLFLFLLFLEMTEQMKASDACTARILPKINLFQDNLLHFYKLLGSAKDEVWVISLD